MSPTRETLQGKTVLVCGAGRPLGRNVAVTLARAGADLALHDLNLRSLEATAEQARALGAHCRTYVSDGGKGLPVRALIEDVVADFERLDALVHALHADPPGGLLSLDEWDWQHSLELNLNGPFLLLQTAAPLMQAQGGGAFVFLLSGLDNPAAPALMASQHALAALVEAASAELMPYNIKCSAATTGDDLDWDSAALQDLLVEMCSPADRPTSAKTSTRGAAQPTSGGED